MHPLHRLQGKHTTHCCVLAVPSYLQKDPLPSQPHREKSAHFTAQEIGCIEQGQGAIGRTVLPQSRIAWGQGNSAHHLAHPKLKEGFQLPISGEGHRLGPQGFHRQEAALQQARSRAGAGLSARGQGLDTVPLSPRRVLCKQPFVCKPSKAPLPVLADLGQVPAALPTSSSQHASIHTVFLPHGAKHPHQDWASSCPGTSNKQNKPTHQARAGLSSYSFPI